jgi:biopolymer transport protein ExbD
MAKKKKRSQVDEAEVPISSMIDVVFLLIIFFVVTAAIDKEIEDEEVKLADAPHGKPLAKKDPRSVTINVRKDGSINMAMMQMSLSQITDQLLVAANRWGQDIPVVIRADEQAQHFYVKKVMDAITKTQLYKVKFNAVVEKEKN